MITEELQKKCEEIESKLLQEDALCLRPELDKEIATIQDVEIFVERFINEFNVYSDITAHRSHTYYVKDRRIHTGFGKYRSTGDLFLIAKHYFPQAKYTDILRAVARLDKEDKIDYFYCPDVQKRVTIRYGVFPRNSSYLEKRNIDEHGITEEELNSLIN